jgi:hypothetical protein
MLEELLPLSSNVAGIDVGTADRGEAWSFC